MPDGRAPYPVDAMKLLSPRRKSTRAADLDSLVDEQLQHFGIDANSPFGQTLARITRQLYATQVDLSALWSITLQSIDSLDRSDKIAYFNAKKFLSFQLAKLLDTLQNPSRRTYQSLGSSRMVGQPPSMDVHSLTLRQSALTRARKAWYSGPFQISCMVLWFASPRITQPW